MSFMRERMSRAARAGEARTPCQNCFSSVDPLERAGLVGVTHRGDEVEGQDAAAAHEHGGEEADPDQADVEAGVIGDARANAEQLAVALVAIEACAARRLFGVIVGLLHAAFGYLRLVGRRSTG